MTKTIIALILFLLPPGTFGPVHAQQRFITNDSRAVVSSDSTGIHCENYRWSPDRLFPKTVWKGQWIWLSKAKYPDFQNTLTEWIDNGSRNRYTALFRKAFNLDTIPSEAVLCITADVSFRAYINGRFVCQGPPNIGSDYFDSTPPHHWYFTTHDVKRFLQPGPNVIAVEAYSFGMAISETTSGNGRLICDLNTDTDHVVLSTDSTWKCMADTCLSVTHGWFRYNAQYSFAGWRTQDYDDSHWPHASVEEGPVYGYLRESRIPSTIRYPLKAIRAFHSSAREAGKLSRWTPFGHILHDQTVTFDFGRNMSAYYSFSIDAHRGDTVRIYPTESKDVDRRMEYICREGKNAYTTPQMSAFRYLRVQVSSGKGLRIDSLHAIYTSYPVIYEGRFSCSDAFYTKLWNIIRWSTQICMQSYHLDSPLHQEPLSDTGDYLIESMSNYYAFGDRWLARQDLIKTAMMLKKNDFKMFHTSYSLLWVQMLHNYFRYTGDTMLVRELVPYVNKLNDLFATYLGRRFLLSQAPNYLFMDWTKIDGFNLHHPPAVIGMGYLTAFYYKSLEDAAYLNGVSGDKAKAALDLHLAGKIKTGINKYLWDKGKGLYRDGIPFLNHNKPYIWLPADTNITTYSPHFNALTVLYDIAPRKRRASIMNYVIHEKTIVVQPYFMYFVLSALAHIHRFDTDGLAAIDKWRTAIDTATHTLTEKWPDKNGYAGDLSHAWGGAPLYFLSSKILGITPQNPGYSEISFIPYAGDKLKWAKGAVPLEDGSSVSVSWTRSGESTYTYRLLIPVNHNAVLHTPVRLQSYILKVNNKTYRSIPKEGIPLEPGRYIITYAKAGDRD